MTRTLQKFSSSDTSNIPTAVVFARFILLLEEIRVWGSTIQPMSLQRSLIPQQHRPIRRYPPAGTFATGTGDRRDNNPKAERDDAERNK